LFNHSKSASSNCKSPSKSATSSHSHENSFFSGILPLFICCALSFSLTGCGEHGKPEPEKKTESSSASKIIPLSEETAKKIEFKTEKVVNRDVIVPLHLTGRIEADYGASVDVSARIAGRITDIQVKPGDIVARGQLLAMVDSPQVTDLQGELVEATSKLGIAEAHADRERQIYEEYLERPKGLLDARALMQNTRVQAELAELEYQRLEGLYKEKIAATKDYLAAKAALARAKVDYENASTALAREEQLYKNRALMKRDYQLAIAEVTRMKQHVNTIVKRLDFLGADHTMTQKVLKTGNINGLVRIVAPISGVVSKYEIGVGEMVQPDISMFKITDLKTVQASADLPEIDLRRVRIGDTVKINVPSFPDRRFEGRIAFISPDVNPLTRTVPIRARLSNTTGLLKTNMYAEIDLEGASRNFLALPKAAIQERDNRKVVFVKHPDGYEERPVTLGVIGEDYIEVKSGLTDGETVATQGSLMLKTELSYRN
jgi:cobalt-zinc-cadmium efflux system membrane fusion protein